MMRSTIANFKENLSRIALEVKDTAEELELLGGEERKHPDGPRQEHNLHLSNGMDHNVKAELDWYKGEIQRLQNSEAEIQAMSVNYASILKEREEELSRLHQENEKLKKTMVGVSAGHMLPNGDDRRHMEITDASKVGDSSSNGMDVPQGQIDIPATRQQRYGNASRSQNSQGILRVHGKHANTGAVLKWDVASNGNSSPPELEGRQKQMELKIKKLQEREKELLNLLQEAKQTAVSEKAENEKLLAEMSKLKELREKELIDSANAKLQLQKEQELIEIAQKECSVLNAEKEGMLMEMTELKRNLNEKNADMSKLQADLSKRNVMLSNEHIEKLQRTIATLEKQNTGLKTEKDSLINVLKGQKQQFIHTKQGDSSHTTSDKQLRDGNQVQLSLENLGSLEEANRLQKLEFERNLKEVCNERDKALRDLARLKQHLLDKELEDSEKMDEDSERIADLQRLVDGRNARIMQLERSLAHAIASQDEIKMSNSDELRKANEIISDLRQKFEVCVSALESKNVEVQNLQTVLGQYYAESEVKDRVFGELAAAREEINKLSENLKTAYHMIEIKNKEKDEILDKLSVAERQYSEGQQRAQKLEEEILRLRRALEQSMTRLNRMSIDSDYFVDRRIVIKLLVTYFQRQHSKEVLDLMVRMLGFSEEDKQRIGLAQQGASKGVVRGVLGFPGRLVGGIMGSGSTQTSPPVPSDNQSFADLWVDFLLKESEERERRENAETQDKAGVSKQGQEIVSGGSRALTASETSTSLSVRGDVTLKSPFSSQETVHSTGGFSDIPITYSSTEQPLRTQISRESRWSDPADTEFSTVPLNSAVSPTLPNSIRHSRMMPRP
ncbi:golgin candidate 4 isoform X2 [Cryptomeria japonica]|uniref:golgin candidate 4 isoform X2 n=1 Tax=Cryptomeria japonica TaxID=3369 RepID=UPI0025AD0215|nr:golgin candidate 4 isoform X2 [Cryptomeria japonica]